jgi:hypothetical protein
LHNLSADCLGTNPLRPLGVLISPAANYLSHGIAWLVALLSV